MKNYLMASFVTALYVGGAGYGFAADKLDTMAKDQIVHRLQAQGVPVESVEEWNGMIRAYVVDDAGKLSMRLFHKGDLRPAA